LIDKHGPKIGEEEDGAMPGRPAGVVNDKLQVHWNLTFPMKLILLLKYLSRNQMLHIDSLRTKPQYNCLFVRCCCCTNCRKINRARTSPAATGRRSTQIPDFRIYLPLSLTDSCTHSSAALLTGRHCGCKLRSGIQSDW
jgi:hypothetical protein